jgi:alkylation response protein AidB-like acyl-CoA dehydrogenase
MDIRGVGDGQAMRRLLWLFLTTVLAPSFVLGLMALGALGHRQWTADEIALQKVEVQLPFVAEEIDPHVDEWEAAEAFPSRALFRKAGALGLLGIVSEAPAAFVPMDWSQLQPPKV